MPPSHGVKSPTRSAGRAGALRRDTPRAPDVDSAHFETIVRSHERCLALGVSRIDHPDHSPITRPDLQVALDRNRRLHEHAAPVMSLLHDQIARTESMVLLTDSAGTIIHAVGDDDFLDRADKVALRAGANWSEGAKGTNAIGTALVDEAPTLVHADEHFLHANQFLTCSAAPILDPRGNVLGVLDVSGDFRSYHRHTLALVRMCARMIENRWLTEDFGHAMRLHFHDRPEFIGTLMEGILAIGEDGRVVGANRGALEHLRMSGASVRMHTLETLFGATLADLADHGRARVALPLSLCTPDGRPFAGFARCNWPVWSPGPARDEHTSAGPSPRSPGGGQAPARSATSATSATSAAPTASGPAPATEVRERAPGTALAALRTGDGQLDAVVEKVRRVLDHGIPILLLGETGTGKEVLARAIHADSARAQRPFVVVNGAAWPEALAEAGLLGQDDGAIPGTRRGRTAAELVPAHGGTLFLDEIGDMPLPLQSHLLRVLQQRQATTPGGTQPVAADLAIVCATHRNLRQLIARQAFREDLYYRLNGLTVRLPALRERTDLMALVRRVLDDQGAAGHHDLAPDVRSLFERHPWPGNLRQLSHVLRAACVMAGRAPLITRAHLPEDFLEEAGAAEATEATATASATVMRPDRHAAGGETGHAGGAADPYPERPPPAPPAGRLEDLEIDLIRRTLEAVGGNISEASKRLGISRNTIYRKVRWNSPG